ncbi:MAG TPA: GMC family oxidoreductase [Stellaceae bacterium]|nr:GMC family oxidoreductase [Stellaceae bacterium]
MAVCSVVLGRLRMFTDARSLPPGSTLAADICIIGAGAAGITLARALGGGELSVAVLESGGFTFEEATQELYDGRLTGEPTTPLVDDRLRYLGGTTNHWSGGCRPFDAHDFAAWPFGLATMEPYYRRAQTICQLGRYSYDADDWATPTVYPLRFAPGATLKSGVYQNSPPTRFGQVYRDELAKLRGLTVYLHANVIDIATSETASEVTGLEVATLDGKRFSAKATLYVLATGAVENARILLNADKTQKTGLGNGYDKVGRYFMDHPYISCVATLIWTGPPEGLQFYLEGTTIDGTPILGYVTATPAVLARSERPSFGIGFQRGDVPDRGFWAKSAEDIYHAVAAGRMPDHLGFHVGRIARGLEWETEDAYRHVFHADASLYSTDYIAECPPDPASRVSLIDERDALGQRRVALDWRLPRDFEANMIEAHDALARELGRAGLGRLRLHSAETGYDPMAAIENGHHHMGTTRMSADPRQGVVDADGKLHGCANLYVAGSSVFPSYSFDNPTLTVVALALKLADRLKASMAAVPRVDTLAAPAAPEPAAATAGDGR